MLPLFYLPKIQNGSENAMASKIPVNSLIKLFQTMYKEHWSYVWGESKKGCVDCSGAFDYAFRVLKGADCPHGSNAMARFFIVGSLLPVSEAKPGMAAFKLREPGEKGYDLPDKYKSGGSSFNGDLNDYYHVGLVDENVKYVLNAKGTNYGFCRDKMASGWDCVGYLKGVDYEDTSKDSKEDIPMQEAKVVLPSGASGSTVRMRKLAKTNADVVANVPIGSVIGVESDLGQWCKIEYDHKSGYMMSNYIEYIGQDDETSSLTDDQRKKIDDALKEIERQINLIGGIVGRG